MSYIWHAYIYSTHETLSNVSKVKDWNYTFRAKTIFWHIFATLLFDKQWKKNNHAYWQVSLQMLGYRYVYTNMYMYLILRKRVYASFNVEFTQSLPSRFKTSQIHLLQKEEDPVEFGSPVRISISLYSPVLQALLSRILCSNFSPQCPSLDVFGDGIDRPDRRTTGWSSAMVGGASQAADAAPPSGE